MEQKKSYPTMSEIADKLNKYKNGVDAGEPVIIDSYTLVWAEYWLRYAMEHCEK